MNKKNYKLLRRGFDLGAVSFSGGSKQSKDIDKMTLQEDWQQGDAIMLSGFCATEIETHSNDIQMAADLYDAVLSAEHTCDELLNQEPYASRLTGNFEALGTSMNEGDDQEIETLLFDANKDGQLVAEDLWMKASWLSFHDEDGSLRFRFSFGVDLHEDVAADQSRQHYASLLTEAIFPESRAITENAPLKQALANVLMTDDFSFVERIVYFNSPNGGAYLHHDRERGHAGVVFAQLTGQTFWLALPKLKLIQEITAFVRDCEQYAWPDSLDQDTQQALNVYAQDSKICSKELESFANHQLIQLINETPEFVQHLIENGYGKRLQAGDILLMPQETEMNCCWHSVFCLGEQAGQALSFAVRTNV